MMNKAYIMLIGAIIAIGAAIPLMAVEVTIGAGEQQALIPVNMYYRTSLFETIYLANEMNIGGQITAIRFYNNFYDNLPDKPTQIWLGETLATDLSGGWIPSSQLTQVFSGNVSYPAGIGTVTINLSTPFFYSGSNLVMMVFRPWDQNYYMPMNYFYAQTVGSSRSLNTYNHNYPIDPEFPPATGVSGQFPKTTFFVTVSGMGSLSGTVSSDGSPLSGALVMVNTTTQSCETTAAGHYSFPYLAEGTHTITASKLGYGTVTHTVTITANQAASQDFALPLLSLVNLTGRVVGSDVPTQGISGAQIRLSGYAVYTATTGTGGYFSLAGVYSGQTYAYSVSAEDYQTAAGEVAVGSQDYDMGDIVLNEIAYVPLNLVAEEAPAGDQVLLTWEAPVTAEEGWLHYDNGENFTSFGTAGSLSFDVAIRFPPSALTDYAGGSLQALRIWPATGGNFSVRVWTGGTATQPATMVVDQPIIPVLNSWNTVLLNDPVLITATEELWFGFLCDVTGTNPAYAGVDPGPAVNGFGNMIFWQGAWTTLLAVNSYCDFNWNIQGYAGLNPPEPVSAPVISPIGYSSVLLGTAFSDNVYRELTGYKVWRLQAGQEESETLWALLTPTAITPTELLDTGWYELSGGVYKWAVKAAYTNEVYSFPVFSNELVKTSLIGTLAGLVRNAQNAPIANATITAGGLSTTSNSNGAYALQLNAGAYSVTCSAQGYYDAVQDNVQVYANQTTSLNFILSMVAVSDEQVVAVNAFDGIRPNPLRHRATLSFSLKQASPVRIAVYNLRGQLVRMLLSGMSHAGNHYLDWDGTDSNGKQVANGIYYCRLEAGKFTAVRRVMVIR